MIIKRISFIEVGSSGFQMLKRYTVARIGTVLLSTILSEKNYDIRIFVEDISAIDWSYVESSDLVCISTLTPTAIRSYTISKKVMTIGIPVIMGGVHPTFLPEEALQFCDFVIRGEGEKTLLELISYLEKGKPKLRDIKGLSYKDEYGIYCHNDSKNFLTEAELNALPIPDFSLIHKWKSGLIYPVSTSRGCPFNCNFCSVVPMFGRKYRFKSIRSVIDELKYVQKISKITRFFVDDNFTANKTRTKELLKQMIAEKLTTRWAAQVRTDVENDDELLRLMADAGCCNLYIGFESINPATLRLYNKKHNVQDFEKCIKAIKDHGIQIHGMFVLGADSDNAETIKNTVDFAIHSGIDTTQLIPLTPLPGTPLFEEMEKDRRLIHKDWSKFNLQHVVFKPANMNPYILQMETLRGMGKFYSWKYILRQTMKLNLRLAVVGLIGKRIVKKTMREIIPYITKIHSHKKLATMQSGKN